jgi:thioredoxin
MNYLKIVTVVLTLTLFSCQGQGQQVSNVEHLDAKTFSDKLYADNQPQLLDVRTPEEFSKQHINNATNINWTGIDFEKKVAEFDKSKPIYVYCLSGGRSRGAVSKLAEMGYTKIYELEGGIIKWNTAGLAKPSSERIGMTHAAFTALLVSDKKVLINFYAEWCAPCKQMAPFIAKMTTEMKDKVTIIRIDADQNKSLMQEMKIEGLPTLLLYENKELKWKNAGFISEADLTQKL